MIIEEEVYLEHFGVLGMKWGVRRDRKQRESDKLARRAKKAQRWLAEADALNVKIKDLENTKVYSYRQAVKVRNKRLDLQMQRREAIENAEAKSKGKLTDKQRRMVTGAAVVGSLLAAYGAYNMVQSGQATRLLAKGKDLFKDKHDPGWKLDRSLADPNLTPDAIMTKVVSKINPNYGTPGTKVNCRRATFAYEMRRRGYDVAATRTTNGYGQNVVGNYNVLNTGKDYPSSNIGIVRTTLLEKFKLRKGIATDAPVSKLIQSGKLVGDKQLNPTSIFQDLSKLPDGARGELGMIWGSGGGHSMAFEIVKGKPVIFDTQSGIKYASQAQFREMASSMAKAGYTRLDNVALDTNFIMRWVKNA